MPGPLRKDPAELKVEPVAPVNSSGTSSKAVAQDLGVNPESLRHRLHQAVADAGSDGPGPLTSGERDAWRRLRRENQVLWQERDIVGKAAAFFARQMGEPVPVHARGAGPLAGQPAVPGCCASPGPAMMPGPAARPLPVP